MMLILILAIAGGLEGLGPGLEKKLGAMAFGAVCFGVVYWWRRRTRPVNLSLSRGAEQLNELVEKSDKPTADEVIDTFIKHDR